MEVSSSGFLTSAELRAELKHFSQDCMRHEMESIVGSMRGDLRDDLRVAFKELFKESFPPTWGTAAPEAGAPVAYDPPDLHAWRSNMVIKEIREARDDEAVHKESEGLVIRTSVKASMKRAQSMHVERRTSTASKGSDAGAVGRSASNDSSKAASSSCEVLPFDQGGVQKRLSSSSAHQPGPHLPSATDLSVVPTPPSHAPETLGSDVDPWLSSQNLVSARGGTRQFEDDDSAEPADDGKEHWGIVTLSRSIVHGTNFDYVVGLLILGNAGSIGIQTDHIAQNRDTDEPPLAIRAVELFFCAVFTIELIIRLIADFRRWFTMAGWRWNVFDSIVVSLQLFEESMNLIVTLTSGGASEQLPNLSFMRVLRILRLVRIIRLVRILRLIGELRTLITSIGSSLKSLGWTVVLLFMIIYAIGIYLTQLVRDHERDDALDPLYGSVGTAMLTLFQSVTGGLDWNDAVTPLSTHISPYLSAIFCMYIAFTVLAVMNVVTGVFVESALLSAKRDQDIFMVSNMRELFIQANGSEDGEMSWERFQDSQHTIQMGDFFRSIDVDASEARGIFRLLDLDKSGGVQMEEFISGCIRLRGEAKALDLAVLIFEIRRMADNFTNHAARVEQGYLFSQMQNSMQKQGDQEEPPSGDVPDDDDDDDDDHDDDPEDLPPSRNTATSIAMIRKSVSEVSQNTPERVPSTGMASGRRPSTMSNSNTDSSGRSFKRKQSDKMTLVSGINDDSDSEDEDQTTDVGATVTAPQSAASALSKSKSEALNLAPSNGRGIVLIDSRGSLMQPAAKTSRRPSAVSALDFDDANQVTPEAIRTAWQAGASSKTVPNM